MNDFKVIISTTKLKHYSRSLKSYTDEETILMMIELFSKYVRRVYVDSIRIDMNSLRYKGEWEPIQDEGYIEYLGTTPERSTIMEQIDRAMIIKKIGHNYIIKIDNYTKYPDSDLTVLEVLNAIERGTSKFNARPLLTACRRDIQSSILKLWKFYFAKRGVLI